MLDGLLRLRLPLTEIGDGQGSAKGLTPGELVSQVDRFLKVGDRQALIRNGLSRGATDGRAVGKLGTGGRLKPSQLGSPAGLPSYSDPKAVRIVTRVVIIGLGSSPVLPVAAMLSLGFCSLLSSTLPALLLSPVLPQFPGFLTCLSTL